MSDDLTHDKVVSSCLEPGNQDGLNVKPKS